MPLLKAQPGWIPETHDACDTAPCIACKAKANLTFGDREIMDFYGIVQDQAFNLTPVGNGDGKPHILSPRLEGWVAACDLYDVPKERRADLVEMARALFEGIHGRLIVHGLHKMPPEAFLGPCPEDLDG